MDPSQLTKRGKDYNAKLQQVNAISIARTGKPFDIAQASIDYNTAKAPAIQQVLKRTHSVLDPNGILDQASAAAAKLPQTALPDANNVINWLNKKTGDENITNFQTTMLGLADDYSKILGGGVSSDTGREQALEIIQAGYSKGQAQGAIKAIGAAINASAHGMVGSNPYLAHQYPEFAKPLPAVQGANQQQGQTKPPATQPPQPGVLHNVVVNGVVVGTTTDGGKTMTPVKPQGQ